MKTLIRIILLIVSGYRIYAANFELEISIKKMQQSGQDLITGKAADTGLYVLYRSEVFFDGDLNFAREKARMKGRQQIAEYINVKIKSKVTGDKKTKIILDGENESFQEIETDARSFVKELDQLQRGVVICKEELTDDKIVLFCLLTERIADETAALERSMKKEGPDTVRVSGTAYRFADMSIELSAKLALQDAQREAIAQVLGISLVSSTAQQSISKSSIDDESEVFSCDDTFKAKVFSSTEGYVESCREVERKVSKDTVTVSIVAKVARNKLIEDYSAYLESMGNPGFCVRANDLDMLELYSGFLAALGLRMVDTLADAAYIIDIRSRLSEDNERYWLSLQISAMDKVSKNPIFALANDPESFSAEKTDAAISNLYYKHLDAMKPNLHQEINRFIGRANTEGRKVLVKLCNYDPEYKNVADLVKKNLGMIPGAKNVKMQILGDEVIYELNFIGESSDLADFLQRQIRVDIRRRSQRPVLGDIENTLIEFNFE